MSQWSSWKRKRLSCVMLLNFFFGNAETIAGQVLSWGFTNVQYTQTDTIRQTDGPLVPMVGLVPIEKDVIPMVLLVNMHLIEGTSIIFPCDWLGTGQLRWSIGTNGTIGTNREGCHSNDSIGEYTSHWVVREGECISLTPELPLQDRSIDWYHWCDWYQWKRSQSIRLMVLSCNLSINYEKQTLLEHSLFYKPTT